MTSSSISAPSLLLQTGRSLEGDDSEIDKKRLKLDSDAELLPSGQKTKKGCKTDAAGWAKSRKGKESDRKNLGRNTRRGTRLEGETEATGDRASAANLKAPRLPKRQCALLIGFCGTGCNGMQIQPDVRTIEGVLFDAMVKAHAISEDNSDDPVKVNLGRAARTDAGVHAAGNVVSIKMIIDIPGVSDIVFQINKELPPEIRVWGYVRVQNSFNARLSCDSRRYTYFFPTYLLISPKPGSGLHRMLLRQSKPPLPKHSSDYSPDSFWMEIESSDPGDDLRRKRSWRLSPDRVQLLRDNVKKFEGTHNFHNFTVGRDFSDRSNQRHMKKIEVSDPAVYGETEWISVTLHGQSFMLHQRKMMSALILCCRTETPAQVIDEMYGPQMVFIPKMPSIGLLLENPIFDSYNNKVAVINQKFQPSDPEYRPPIDFEVHKETMVKFKQQYIYDNMRKTEDRDGIFDRWVRFVDSYGGNDLQYLNPKGIIPLNAVIKKGEKRDNPFKEQKCFDATSFPMTKVGKTGMDVLEEGEEDAALDRKRLADTEG